MFERTVKVLLVEDSEDDYVLTRDILRDAGGMKYALTWARTPAAALERLREDSPDVLLVDWVLGELNGMDFLREARAAGARVPAILLTGYSSEEIEDKALRAGMTNYLEKSQLSGPLLDRTIHFALERQEILNRLEEANAELEKRVAERTCELEDANAALREANTALAGSNELFERMFSSIHLNVAYLDRSFNIIRVNLRFAEEDGRPVAFFPGKNYFALYPGAENEAIFRRVIETGQPYIAHTRPFVHPDHPRRGAAYFDWHLIPVKEADGAVSGVIVSNLNVTEQQRDRQAIAYQAHLLENVSDAIIAAGLDLRLTAWNRAAEQIYGWKREEVLGKDVADLLRPDLDDENLALLANAVKNEGEIEGVARVRHRDGRLIPVEARISTLRGEDGAPVGYVSIHHDITRRLEAEENARQSHKRLAAQAEISRLMGGANLDYRKILSILAVHAAEMVGDACVVMRVSDDGQELIPEEYHHTDPQGLEVLRQVLPLLRNRVGQGYSGQAAQSGQAVLLPSVPQAHARKKISPFATPYLDRFGVHSVLIVPIKVQEQVVGTVGVTRDQPGRPYTQDDQLFLEALADRAATWINNAELYEKAQSELIERRRVEAELYEIQRRLNDGIEAERLQLARELHDGPIQDLYGLSFQLHALGDHLPGGTDNEELEELKQSIQRIVDSLRHVTMELRPPTLSRVGLGAAIQSHCEMMRRNQPHLEVALDLDDEKSVEHVLSERVRLALFRIVQVALTNVVRHANASRVTVRLVVDSQHAALEIADNGVGFNVPLRWLELARQGHLGLVGAKERVEALGGTMEIISAPGSGTALRVVVPKDA